MQIWCEKSMANLMANLLCEKIRHHRSIMIYLLFALSWSLMPYEVQLDNSWIFSYLFHLHGNRFIANTLLIAHEKFHAEAVVRRLRPGAAPAQLTPSLKSGSIADIAANCSKSIVFWQNFGEVGSDRQKHLNYLNCNFMTFLVEQAWLQKFAALRCASLEGGAGLATGLSMLSRWWLKHQMNQNKFNGFAGLIGRMIRYILLVLKGTTYIWN